MKDKKGKQPRDVCNDRQIFKYLEKQMKVWEKSSSGSNDDIFENMLPDEIVCYPFKARLAMF